MDIDIAVDKALTKIGGYRRWHITMFVLLGFSCFGPLAFHSTLVIFVSWPPWHYCRLPQGVTLDEGIPLEPNIYGPGLVPSSCRMFANSTTNKNKNETRDTTSCTNGWTYVNEGYYSIVEQWDLVCNRNHLPEFAQTMFLVGYLFSVVALSWSIDVFGRKYIHILSHLAIVAIGVAIAYVPTLAAYTALKAILGVLVWINQTSGFTYLMEIFDKRRRAFAGVALEFPWVACYLLLVLLAYFVKDWRTLQAVFSATSIIWVILFWIIPRSPVWLLSIGHLKEADVILRKMARWNNISISPDTKILELSDSAIQELKDRKASRGLCVAKKKHSGDGEKENKRPSVLVLFTDRYMLRIMIVVNLIWFANALVYYGMILSTPLMVGNRFLNFAIMGFVEIPAVFVAWFSADRFGRRIPTCVYQICAGVPLAIVPSIPTVSASGKDLVPLIITLVMISKFFIMASFSILLLYAKELLPTYLRGTGTGIGTVLGSVGFLIAPYIAYLYKTHLYWLANVIFGVLSVVMGFLTLALPETAGKPLAQTVEDIQELFEKTPRKNDTAPQEIERI